MELQNRTEQTNGTDKAIATQLEQEMVSKLTDFQLTDNLWL
jgi:hypothetical protein